MVLHERRSVINSPFVFALLEEFCRSFKPIQLDFTDCHFDDFLNYLLDSYDNIALFSRLSMIPNILI